MSGLRNHIANKLLAGVFAAVPVAVTGFVLWYVDSKARALFAVEHPALGILITLGVIYGLGLFVTSFVGRHLLRAADALLNRAPGLKELYRAWKQVALTSDGHEGVFSRVVLVPDETGHMHLLGFTTGRAVEGDPDVYCVFVPGSPNPTTGRLLFVPGRHCRFVDLPAKEAFKLIVSGGNYVPAAIGAATRARA